MKNKEFSDGTGLELYETSFRMLDPQLGRFSQIDPLADNYSFTSSYNYALNNPVIANDPTGLKAAKIDDLTRYNLATQAMINTKMIYNLVQNCASKI